ncbi:MAG TPA: carboxypeptidase-like regulatory domain-containing protein [Candidatus Bathyarchaeia archaeon]|nr:carboxypeptidase-like regulatory domain-containing protein [Candidatus Bathyarchaeia archaeon]
MPSSRGPSQVLVIIGALMLVVGGVGAIFAQSTIPVASNPLTVDCSSGSYCLVQYLVTNVAATSNNQPTSYQVDFCTYANAANGRVTAPSFSNCYQQFNGNPVYYDETLYTGTLAVGQQQVLSFQIPLRDNLGNVLLPMGNYFETACLQDSYTSTGNNCGVTGNVITFNQGTAITSTTIATTGPQPFLIYYGPQFSNLQVGPSGSNVQACTNGGSCPQGANTYQASWNVGTQLSITVSFSSAFYNANACIVGTSSCQTITSGQAFTITTTAPGSNGVPGTLILQAQASQTPPITIVPQSAGVVGSWSPSSAQTINPSPTSPTSVTFKFTSNQGYSCSGSWILYSPGSNQYFTSGLGSVQGVTFQYSQLQQYIANNGYTFYLYSGSQSDTGCHVPLHLLKLTGIGQGGLASYTCTSFDPTINSQNTYVCPASSTFASGSVTVTANPSAGYGYPVTYTTNGIVGSPIGGATSTTPAGVNAGLTLNMNQNYTISASFTLGGQSIGGSLSGSCTLSPSTNGGMAVTVFDLKTGKPISGATVVLDPGNGASQLTGTTNGAGQVILCNFPVPTGILGYLGASNSGAVKITVSQSGYSTSTTSPIAYQGVTTSYTVTLNPSIFGGGLAQAILFGVAAGGVVVLGLAFVPGIGRRASH